MKKLTIMLEYEPLKRVSNPVPRGRQKQFPLIKFLSVNPMRSFILAFAMVFVATSSLRSETVNQETTDNANTMKQSWPATWFGGLTWQQEKDEMQSTQNRSLAEVNNPTGVAGLTYIDGLTPVVVFAYSGQYTFTADLTFGWVNPSTIQPVAGPTVGSVNYYMWDGVDDAGNLFSSYNLMGTSTDAADGFPLEVTYPLQEAMFIAQPLDPSGDTIVLLNPDGNNDALEPAEALIVPEPSTIVFLAAGAISLLTYAWRRRRTA
jgi:hypothetical protein